MITTVSWAGDQWLKRFVEEAVNPATTDAAAVVADRMARNMGTEGGGVIGPDGKLINVLSAKRDLAKRRKFKKRQRYVAAPPGAYPGVRTGHLRRSITYVGPDATGAAGVALAGTAVAYGRHLEFGTMGFPDIQERPGGGHRTVAGVRMAARPWAMRSALEAKGAATAAFTARVTAGMARLSAEYRAKKGAA